MQKTTDGLATSPLNTDAPLGKYCVSNGAYQDFRLGFGTTDPKERISVSGGFREIACLKADGTVEIVDDLTLEEARRAIRQMIEAWRDAVSTP